MRLVDDLGLPIEAGHLLRLLPHEFGITSTTLQGVEHYKVACNIVSLARKSFVKCVKSLMSTESSSFQYCSKALLKRLLDD